MAFRPCGELLRGADTIKTTFNGFDFSSGSYGRIRHKQKMPKVGECIRRYQPRWRIHGKSITK